MFLYYVAHGPSSIDSTVTGEGVPGSRLEKRKKSVAFKTGREITTGDLRLAGPELSERSRYETTSRQIKVLKYI